MCVCAFVFFSNRLLNIWLCLFSEVMRNDTLRGQRPTIPKECRQQVRAQLYQQRENIDFDPKLKSACKEEINQLCLNVPHGAGQVNKRNASFIWFYEIEFAQVAYRDFINYLFLFIFM